MTNKGFFIRFGRWPWFRVLCAGLALIYACNWLGLDAAQASLNAPVVMVPPPGTLMTAATPFSLPVLKAIAIDPANPFKMDFVVDTESRIGEANQAELRLLVKYFLSFLTLPEGELWVNLSPYEQQRIITPVFETTNAGRDMLLQDYTLKQLASSLTYPNYSLGRIFWQKVFARARAQYGTSNVPVSTFNKVWVVPESATVYEEKGAAFIAQSRLKVMVEEDYLSTVNSQRLKNLSTENSKAGQLSSEIMREVIIPELDREVNEGQYFASLRQMYSALILAIWFKKRLKENLINQVYADQKKTSGILLNERQVKEKIYTQYIKALKKGAYNFVREDYDAQSHQTIPRKYFSGGFSFVNAAMAVHIQPVSGLGRAREGLMRLARGTYRRISVFLRPIGLSKVALLTLAAGLSLATGVRTATARDLSSTQRREDKIVYLQQGIESIEHKITEAHAQGIRDQDAKLSDDWDHLINQEKLLVRTMESPLDTTERTWRKAPLELPDTIKESQEHVQAARQWLENAWEIKAHESTQKLFTKGVELQEGQLDAYEQMEAQAPAEQLGAGMAMPQPTPPALQPTMPQEHASMVDQQPNNPPSALSAGSSPPPPPPVLSIAPPTGVVAPPVVVRPPVVPGPLSSTIQSTPQAQGTPPPVIQELEGPSYHLAVTGSVVPFNDSFDPKFKGTTMHFDPNKSSYKAGDKVFFIFDPDLEGQIEELTSLMNTAQRELAQQQKFFAEGMATAHDVTLAQQQVDGLSQKLALAREQEAQHWIIAPYDFVLQPSVHLPEEVAPGKLVLPHIESGRTRVIVQFPRQVDYLGHIKNLTVNGQAVQGILQANWAPDPQDPLGPNAQVEMIIVPGSPIVMPQVVSINADIFAPADYFPELNSLTGIETSRAPIASSSQYDDVIRPAANGLVSIKVHEGQRVYVGTLLAVTDPRPYQEQLKTLAAAIQDKEQEIAEAFAGGVRSLTQDKVDLLTNQRTDLVIQFNKTEWTLQHLEIRSSYNGIVKNIAAYGSHVFGPQEELMRIDTGHPTTLDISDMTHPALFRHHLNIGDPLVVEDAHGLRLPGLVINVNETPAGNMNLDGYHAIEVMAFDHQNVLKANQWVRIIVPQNSEETDKILSAIARARALDNQPAAAGSAPPPVLTPLSVDYIVPDAGNNTTVAPHVPTALQAPAQQPGIGLTQVLDAVYHNRLITWGEALDVMQKKFAEGLPTALRFDWKGQLMYKEGKFYESGGFSGMFGDAIKGGFQTGNAISPLGEMVWDLAGNLVDLVDGKIGKEVQIAKQETAVTTHHMHADVAHQGKLSQDLLVNLGAMTQEIAGRQAFLNYLEHLRSGMNDRVAAGYSLDTDEGFGLAKLVHDTRMELSELQNTRDNLTVELNIMMGTPLDHLHQAVPVSVPWGKTFGTIDQQTEDSYRNALIGAHSPSPRMQEALATEVAVGLNLKLEGLKTLPTLYSSNIYLQNGAGSTSFYNLSDNEYVQRTSELQKWANNALALDVPVFDQGAKINMKIMALEKEKSRLNVQKAQADLSEELAETIDNINDLSAQIKETQSAYGNMYRLFIEARQSGSNASYQLAPKLDAVLKCQQTLIDLKARYFQQESTLREMGLIGQESSSQEKSAELQVMEALPQAVASAVGSGVAQVPGSAFSLPVPSSASIRQAFDQQPAPTDSLAAGTVNDQLPSDVSAWVLMSQDPLGALKKILIEDQNIFVRADALQYFKTQYPDDQEALKDIVRQSPFADVVQPLLQYMAQRDDRDLRFFVQIIQEAELKHNDLLIDLGFRTLGGILNTHSQDVANLTREDISHNIHYPQLSPADKVALTYLAWEPDNLIAKEFLLRSDNFWSPDDLGNIYRQLSSYAIHHKDDQHIDQVNALIGLVKDSILRREAIANIGKVFTSGSFGTTIWDGEIHTYVKIISNAEDTRRFLETSPEWRQMKQFIHPKLYRLANEEMQKIIKDGPRTEGGDPVYGFFKTDVEQHDGMAYFKRLGLEDQRQHIAKSQDVFEWINILGVKTPARADALKRLMDGDTQAHIQVLRAYRDAFKAKDTQLLGLIESYKWWDVLTSIYSVNHLSDADIRTLLAQFNSSSGASITQLLNGTPDIKVAADNQIVREALETMYSRVQERIERLKDQQQSLADQKQALEDQKEDYLNLRLLTYSVFQLNSLDDPRGNGIKEVAINGPAIDRALEFHEQKRTHRFLFFAGQSDEDKEVVNAKMHIRLLRKNIDPRVANDFVQNYRPTDKNAAAFMDEIRSATNGYANEIRANDQSIPLFPVSYIILGAVGVLGVLGKKVYKQLRGFLMRRKSIEAQINDIQDQLISDVNGNSQITWGQRIKGLLWVPGWFRKNKMSTPTPSDPRVYKPTAPALKKWNDLFLAWGGQQGPIPAQRLKDDLSIILNCAEEIVKKMPYESKLMFRGEGEDLSKGNSYRESYAQFIILALRTLNAIRQRLNNDSNLNETQKRWLQSEVNKLQDYTNYANRFSRVLGFRGAMDTVINHKFNGNHWTEYLGLNKLNRLTHGESPLLSASLKGIKADVPDLLDEGNALIPGLYENKRDIIKETTELLDTATFRGGSLYNLLPPVGRNVNRMGNFWDRFGSGLVTDLFLVFAAAAVSFGIPNLIAKFTLPTVVFIIVQKWMAFFEPNAEIAKMRWSRQIDQLLNKRIKVELDNKLNPSGQAPARQELEMVRLSQREGEEQRAREVKKIPGNNPNVDIVVIVPKDRRNIASLRQYVENRQAGLDPLIRDDIPALVLPSDYEGSGNAYLDVLLQVNRNLPAYREKYPRLRSVKKPRVLFIFHDSDVAAPDIQDHILDMAIKDGYRMARNDPSGGYQEGGNILIYSRDAYFGQVPYFPKKGITLMTSKRSSEEFKEYGHPVTHENKEFDLLVEVTELLEKVDIELLKNDPRPRKGRTLQYLEDKFDLKNNFLEQFPTLNGRIALAPDAVDLLTKIAEHVDEDKSWKQWNRHLAGDLLVPILMMMSKLHPDIKDEEMEEYVIKRSQWEDIVGHGKPRPQNGELKLIQSHLRGFYNLIEEYDPNVKVDAFLPHATVSLHMAGRGLKTNINRFKKLVLNNNAQLASKAPGGIDLTTTAAKIRYKQGAGADGPAPTGAAAPSLKFFEGFDFKIVQFPSAASPMELFLNYSADKRERSFS